MNKLIKFGKKLHRNEDGATAIEYGLLAALISVAIIAIVGTLGQTLQGTFTDINTELADAPAEPAEE
jgi:pilus assembly protein Flp/PilA